VTKRRHGSWRGWLKPAGGVAGAVTLAVLTALPAAASGDPQFDREWALKAFDVQAIRDNFHAYGTGVTVAVIDSGVDPTAPDLQGQLVPGIDLENPSDPQANTDDTSPEYHGTHVSAIIVAHGHGSPADLQGVVGLASRAKVMPVKDGGGRSTTVADSAAVRYAVDHGIRIINMSIGGDGHCDKFSAEALDYALSRNVIIVAAAGNDAKTNNVPSCPADQPGVISVAAIGQTGKMDVNSHYGRDVTVAAPGVDIEVPAPHGQYKEASGTSDATPWVSAEAALIIGLHPDWTAGQVIRVIIDNTVTGTGKRIDDHIGYGVIDPLKALGAPAPADKSNPLGGPALSGPGAAASGAASSGAAGAAASSPATATPGGKSSNTGLYAGLGAGVLVVLGVIAFVVGPGRGGGGRGGPGRHGGLPAQPPPGQYPEPSRQPHLWQPQPPPYPPPPYPQPPSPWPPPPEPFPPHQLPGQRRPGQ